MIPLVEKAQKESSMYLYSKAILTKKRKNPPQKHGSTTVEAKTHLHRHETNHIQQRTAFKKNKFMDQVSHFFDSSNSKKMISKARTESTVAYNIEAKLKAAK